MAPQDITYADIVVAQAVLESRKQAAAHGEDMEDLEDVVIARNVTLEELSRVPDEWIKGMKIALRADGSLILIDQFCLVCTGARGVLVSQVVHYGMENRDRVYGVGAGSLAGQRRIDVDAALYARDAGGLVAIAAFEVECPNRTGSQLVENAARILNNVATVECIVCLKFFRARTTREEDGVRVPALLVVFRRCPLGRDRQLGRIQLAESLSFGNESNDERGLAFLRAPGASHLIANPLHGIRHLTKRSPAFPDAFDEANFDASLNQALARAHAMARRAWNPMAQVHFPVHVRPQLPPVHLDLAAMYVNGVRMTRPLAGRGAVQVRGGWVMAAFQWLRNMLGW